MIKKNKKTVENSASTSTNKNKQKTNKQKEEYQPFQTLLEFS